MNKRKRYRSLRRVVVAFAAVAVAIPAAHAQAKHGVGAVQPGTVQGTKLGNGAPMRSYLRLPRDLPSDDQEALRHPGSVAIGGYSPSALGSTSLLRTSTPVAPGTSPFSWGDAGIGAASSVALMLLATLAVLLVRRSRTGQPAH
jgi:hypothetical protein